MDTKILEDIGLTKSEIKVYLALLELGTSSAGTILDKANIQNSVLHFGLNNLIKKGLVTYIKKGKKRIYQAANPDSLVDYIEEKRKDIQKILPELKEKQQLIKEKEEAEIFEGIRGVLTALNILIEGGKPKDEYLFFSADIEEQNEKIQKFYKRHDAKRKEKRLIVKGIAPKKLRPLFEKRKYLKMKYVNFPIPENTGICNDKMTIISWGDQPRAILITSKQIVEKQRRFFNETWKRIKSTPSLI